MNYSEHWHRWITASVAKHFAVGLEPREIKLFVEGFERPSEDLNEWVELRIDGPFTEEMTRGVWRLDIEINVLICINEDAHAYRTQIVSGIITKLFERCIDVYKYGDEEDDDGTQLGCLVLRTDGRNKIVPSNFGKVRPDTRHLQSSVEAHYQMDLG